MAFNAKYISFGGQLVLMDIFTCMPGFSTRVANIKVTDVTTCYFSLRVKQGDQTMLEQLYCKAGWGLGPLSNHKNGHKHQKKLTPRNDCSLKRLC